MTNSMFRVKPLVVFAARMVGDRHRPLRLEMVKLAHDLDDRNRAYRPLHGRQRSTVANLHRPEGAELRPEAVTLKAA